MDEQAVGTKRRNCLDWTCTFLKFYGGVLIWISGGFTLQKFIAASLCLALCFSPRQEAVFSTLAKEPAFKSQPRFHVY